MPQRLTSWIASLAIGLAGAPLVVPASVAAAPVSRKAIAEAEALSKQAVERFKNKDFDAASELFMRAYELARKPASVFNAARAKEDAGKLAEAKALYELYGRISDSPDGVVDARKRIEAIDATLAERKAAEEERARQARLDAAAAEERAAAAKRAAEEQAARAREAEERLRKSEADAKERANAASAAAAFAVAVLPPRAADADAAGLAAVQRLVAASVAEAAAAGLGPVRTPAELQTAIDTRGASGPCDHPCELASAARLGVGWAVTWTAWRDGAGGHVRGALWRVARDGAGVEVAAVEQIGPNVTSAVERLAAWQVGGLFDPARRLLWSPAGSPVADQGDAALLRVESVPSGATLFVDEQPSGQTPRSLRLRPGAHRLRVTLQGHADRAGTIDLAPGSAGRTSIALVALPPAPTPPTPAVTTASQPGVPQAGPSPARPPAPQPQPGPSGQGRPEESPANRGQPLAVAPQPQPQLQPQPQPQPQPLPQPQPQPLPQPQASYAPPRTGASSPVVTPPDEPNSDVANVTGGFYVYGQGGALTYESKELGFDTAVGLLGHVGYGPANEVPWVALLLGLERRLEASDPKGRQAWAATGVWGGVALPRAAGLLFSVHRQSFDVVVGPLGKTGNTTIAVRKLFGGQRAYIAFGAETLVSSTRSDVDDSFGPGPRFRMMVEVGVGGFGRGLVR